MNTDKTPKKKPGRPKITTENNITREQILKTAAHLFMAYGYEKVSMEQVAEASDVTKASVYYYFKNKATLFTVSVSSMFQRITKQTEKLLQNSKGLKHRLYEVTLDHLKRPHIDFETLLQEATSSLTEGHIQEIREAEKAIHEALENVFKQAANSGEIVVASPRLLAHTFSTVTMIRNKKELITELGGPEKTAQALVDLFWVGISPN
ncbi:TetR/AcrR family transcriptional regulator [Priestia megaterium]|uniref:TetR/AcrR family transcriptional regulator n=1 Tax=Priestia megaterium TaxID=1404 RepID=UPI001F12B039|nr:TetR/AcrR family transcriptional regulator [Priestia megaterium]UMZ34713.1 TetR/AcrR family transcriptional regulator [Priestia megaterium]